MRNKSKKKKYETSYTDFNNVQILFTYLCVPYLVYPFDCDAALTRFPKFVTLACSANALKKV